MKQLLSTAVLGLLLSGCLLVKQKKADKKIGSPTVSTVSITELQLPLSSSKIGLKSFQEVINSQFQADSGFFNIYNSADKFYLEIPDGFLGRDILLVNRIARAAMPEGTTMMGLSGEEIRKKVIRFTKGPKHKIYVHNLTFSTRSVVHSEDEMNQNLMRSAMEPISASFDIKATGDAGKSSIIDISEFITADNEMIGFGASARAGRKLSALQKDRSQVLEFKAHPENLELLTQNTYSTVEGFATFELNNSFVLLPETPMKARIMDKRVGFFEEKFTQFNASTSTIDQSIICRFPLEPKKEDVQKYLSGELVEPVKPIIFYIDPLTPKKWVKYFILGVNDWQKAFEKAGFKNAIYALEAPNNSKDWSLYDSRHNAILYMPSTAMNAQGNRIHDPRSGEILEAHIYWYHNFIKKIQEWYMIQAGPNDPLGRKMILDEETMGRMIRYVTSHEVGHSIGLRHNFIASTSVPVDSLRSKSYLQKFGSNPSIMDYSRLNYVVQPADKIPVELLVPRIGIYDEWAIEWGYRWFPENKSLDQEHSHLTKWTTEKLKADKRLYYVGDFGFDPNDPRVLHEDLGDDAVKASAYGIANLKIVAPNLITWTQTPNGNYENLISLNKALFLQYQYYMEHVLDQIRLGVFTIRLEDESENAWGYQPKAKKRAALAFLHQNLFTKPSWLINQEVFKRTGFDGMAEIRGIQNKVLGRLFHKKAYDFIDKSNVVAPVKEKYSFDELLSDLSDGVFQEVSSGSVIAEDRRNLQLVYVEKLIELQELKDSGTYELQLSLKQHANNLISKFNSRLPYLKDPKSNTHICDLLERLQWSKNPMSSIVKPKKI